MTELKFGLLIHLLMNQYNARNPELEKCLHGRWDKLAQGGFDEREDGGGAWSASGLDIWECAFSYSHN